MSVLGIGSTGKGYNTEDYDYELFTVSAIDPNYGGNWYCNI